MKKMKSYQDFVDMLYPADKRSTRSVTLQVTEACNLQCTYCYQTQKSGKRMSFETAKKFVDYLLSDKSDYINTGNTKAITLDFIGGEPLLEIDLIDKICDYWLERCIELRHPWAVNHMFSM